MIQRYSIIDADLVEESKTGIWVRYSAFERRERELLGLLREWRVSGQHRQCVLIRNPSEMSPQALDSGAVEEEHRCPRCKRTDLALAERESI